MIEIPTEELKSVKEVQSWYKQNLANTVVNHPILGDIIIFNRSFNETRNKIPDKYICVLLRLKELLQTGTTNGKLVKPNKPREDGALGFYYLYNKLALEEQILSIRMDILVAKDHKKYYLLQFTKNESHDLDFCMSITGLSERSIMTSNNIITYNEEKVNLNSEDVKVGDVFWLGDFMRIEVVEIKNKQLQEEDDEEARQHRLRNKEKSDAAKLAWKRHHASYMTGTRKRGRNMDNRTFYSLAQELNSKTESCNEESVMRDNDFQDKLSLSFDTISGGISMGIKDGRVSFSCSLEETGSGSYGLEQGNIEDLYKPLAEDLQNICKMVDNEMRQILAKYGLKSTK